MAKAAGDHAEVIRRIGILFRAPPKFLADSLPDLATLEQHWDKLAAPSRAGAIASQLVSPSDMAAYARQLAEEESLAAGGDS
jgi:hypothetical protein